VTTASKPKPISTSGNPKDGMPSMLSYLTRVLKMPAIGAFWEELAEQARDQNWSHEEYLAALLQRQVADRESKGTTMRIRTAHFRRSRRWKTSTSTTCPRSVATSLRAWRPARSSRRRRT
jgi:DNA replication protein DnaC